MYPVWGDPKIDERVRNAVYTFKSEILGEDLTVIKRNIDLPLALHLLEIESFLAENREALIETVRKCARQSEHFREIEAKNPDKPFWDCFKMYQASGKWSGGKPGYTRETPHQY